MADLSWVAWPGAAVAIAVYGMRLFRENIGRMIDRAEKAKLPGVDISAPTQPQVATDPESPALPKPKVQVNETDSGSTSQSVELPATTPLVLQTEGNLRAELATALPNNPSGQLAVSLRALALSRLMLAHEANYRVIFSTQIMLLKGLNDNSIRDTTQAHFWYNVFHERLPDVALTFDEWLRFLENCGYIQVGERVPGLPSSLTIDPFGRDFLLWMIHHGISEARPG